MLRLTWRAGRWPLAIAFMAAALAACSDAPTAARPVDTRSVNRDVQPQAGLAVVYLDIDKAVIGQSTGQVFVTGTVSCSLPSSFDLVVDLHALQKRSDTMIGMQRDILPRFQCEIYPKQWTGTFENTKELRQNGRVLVEVYTGEQQTPVLHTKLTGYETLIRER